MIQKHEMELLGKFKFEVYSQDKLSYSTDYLKNFITLTGLSYVKDYAFADCFRYISLGTGTTNNSINGIGTTGLAKPASGFQYIGGNRHSNCFNGPSNQYVAKGCGYRVNTSGITLLRAWRIPADDSEFFSKDYNFQEYMLSPGRPLTTGMGLTDASEWILSGVCDCQETLYVDDSQSESVFGKESFDYHAAYPNICKATGAFSRIVKNIPVNSGDYLVVYYALDLNFNTGVKYFTAEVKRNSPSGPNNNEYNWPAGNSVSGYSSIVHPGIKLINNGNVTQVDNVNQIDNYEYRGGESFIPPLGISLEPSCPSDNRIAWLSSDNIQFIVNNFSGGAWNSDLSSKAFSSGVLTFRKDWITDSSTEGQEATLGDLTLSKPYFYRPRTTTVDTIGAGTNYPSQSDYTSPTDSLSVVGLDVRQVEPSVIPSAVFDNASYPETGRTRSVTVTFQFKDPALSPETMPVRAIVYGYRYLDGADNSQWYPVLDSVLGPTGAAILPSVNKISKTYSSPEANVGGKLSVGHYFFDSSNILQTRMRVNWTSPCEAGVDGC